MMLAAWVINWSNGLGSQMLNTASTAINRAIAATQLWVLMVRPLAFQPFPIAGERRG